MQSARRDASRPGAAEALFLKSLVPALLILAPWELGKISLRGLLSPSNLPKALASKSTCVWSGNKQGRDIEHLGWWLPGQAQAEVSCQYKHNTSALPHGYLSREPLLFTDPASLLLAGAIAVEEVR